MKPIEPVEPDKAVEIIKEASEALSHASYCAITGMRVKDEYIGAPWDALRNLIQNLDPEPTFYPDNPEPEPLLKIISAQSPSPIQCRHYGKYYLCGGSGSGPGLSERYGVTLCPKCGQFHVYMEKNGQSLSLNFALVLNAHLDAAAEYIRILEQEEGENS